MKKHLLHCIVFMVHLYLAPNYTFSQNGITPWNNFPVTSPYSAIKKDIYIDPHDTVFLITSTNSGNEAYILSFKNGNWNGIPMNISMPTSICKWNNELYAGTKYNGFYHVNPGTEYSSSNTNCFLNNHVFKIRGYGNKLYVATAKGIVIWDGTNFTCHNSSNTPIINDTILDFTFKNNKLYLATPDGFYIRSGNNWQSFNSINILNTKHYIDAIDVDDAGNVWVTSRQSPTGLLMWNGYNISDLTERFERSAMHFSFKAIDIINIPGKGMFIPGHTEFIPNVLSPAYIAPAILINQDRIETYCIGNYMVSWKNNIQFNHIPNGTLLAVDAQNNIYFINKFQSYYSSLYKFNPDNYEFLNCHTFDNFKFLDINKLKGTVGAFNATFPYGINSFNKLKRGLWIKEFPNIQNAVTLSLWAIKSNGPIVEFLTADRGFKDNSPRDTWPGPLKIDGSAGIDLSVAKQYNRVWKVSQAEIDDFLFHLNNGSVAAGLYQIPKDILEWPVSGPAGYDPQLAPFVDANNDGNYNPLDGDYPAIKGKQMLYFVLNDKLDTHQSGGLPLGLEIRVSVYACRNDSATGVNDIINRTVFQEYEIINRNNQSLDSIVFSFFADYDIRDVTSNYVGTHVDENATYGVFSTGSDEPIGGNFLNIAQSMQILNMPIAYNTSNTLSKTMHFQACNNCALGDPIDIFEYKRYMEGKFMDDSPLHYGGIGYPGTINVSNIPSHFAFPGYSDPTNKSTNGIDPGFIWDELTAMNSPVDKRIVATTKAVKLLPHIPVKFTIGMITTYDSLLTTSQLIAQNRFENQILKYWTAQQAYPCYEPYTATLPELTNTSVFKVYPNPTDGMVNIASITKNIQQVMITDLQGKIVLHKKYSSNETDIQLKLHHLSAGTYFMKIMDSSGYPSVFKIILK